MKAKRKLFVRVCSLVLLALAVWLANGGFREPTSAGKPVSYWLDELESAPVAAASVAEAELSTQQRWRAREALMALGPDALPYIAARIEGSWFKRNYSKLINRLPARISRYLPKLTRPANSINWQISGAFLITEVAQRSGTNAIPALVVLYGSSNMEVRRGSFNGLSIFAARDHAQVRPVLERALQDPHPLIHRAALRQLCIMAGTDPQVVPILIKHLNDPRSQFLGSVRLETIVAAGTGESSLMPGATVLAWTVSGTNTWERALAYLGEWNHAPTEANRQRAMIAFRAACANPAALDGGLYPLCNLSLTAAQEAETLVPLLTNGLTAAAESVRVSSASLLANLGPVAEPALPGLVAALDDPSANVRNWAMQAIGALGPKAAPAVPELLRRLPMETNFWQLTATLRRIGPAAIDAAPVLIRMAKETRGRNDRREFLSDAVDLDPRQNELVPLLLSHLYRATDRAEDDNHEKWENMGERRFAVAALGEIGIGASNAIPALNRVLQEDPRLEPRLAAMESLLTIDPAHGPALVPIMLEAVSWPRSFDDNPAHVVARLLGRIGPAAAPEVIPALRGLLRNPDVVVQLAAAEALAKAAPESQAESIEVLHRIIAGHPDASIRFRALKTLRRVAPDDSIIVPELVKLIRSYEHPQEELSRVLGEMGAAASAAVPALRETLESPEWKARRAARDSLDKILRCNTNNTTAQSRTPRL